MLKIYVRTCCILVLWVMAGLTLGACAASQTESRVGRRDIKLHGTYVFNGTREEVFNATVMALKTVGFRVTLRNLSRGILMTGRIVVSEDVDVQVTDLFERHASVSVSRRSLQMKVWLNRVAPKRTEVKLVPIAFRNGHHVGYWPWGRARMRGLWMSIRNKIHMALPGRN